MAEEKLVSMEGTVESIVFHNPENGYTVLDVDNGENLITVVGNMGEVNEGDRIKVMGSFTSHHSFGMQFKAVSWEVRLPEGAAAIERYLASGAVKGIGPALAKRIVTAFGDKTLQIIEDQPELLADIKGISPEKAAKIEEEFKKVHGMRTVMVFLARFQVPMSCGVRAWKQFGSLAVDLIQENPFVLCINSIGLPFRSADQIRSHLEIGEDAECRLCAGVLFTLQKQQWEGHSCFPEEMLVREAASLLHVSENKLDGIIEQLHHRESIYIEEVEGTRFIYLPDAHRAEEYISTRIGLMMRSMPNLGYSWEKKIQQLEAETGLSYAGLQKDAIGLALNSPVMVLTGGPGTGKTTTLNAIIQLFKNEGNRVSIVAPTGRAAKRISDLTGYEAKTIHRLLGVEFGDDHNQQFVHNEQKLLPCDVLIVDELSMVDTLIFESLLRALRLSCRVVLVGDNDQLPPVGMGNVLKDIIDSECVPTVKLTEIFRQAAESLIVTNAHAIIEGNMPDLRRRDSDFFFMPENVQPRNAQTVLDLCSKRLPKAYGFSPLWDIQVLCPTKIGMLGTVEMNNRLQAELNPFKGPENEIKYGNCIYRVGDKVMQTRNNYDIIWKRQNAGGELSGTGVFNGDIGTILFIDKTAGALKISFDDRVADYLVEQLNEIDLAYAITVHKSQGSEFDAVILPLAGRGGRMYYRNLLYTAVTRAKKLMIIIGTGEAVQQMVSNTNTTLKYTNLRVFLRRETGVDER